MSREKMYEVILPVDRWSIRAISPLDIREGADKSTGLIPVVFHPGWAKSPERHASLLLDALEAGFLPIGVDTRYGYSNQQSGKKSRTLGRLVIQSYDTGNVNPYFLNQNKAANRWELRRPTNLLYLCQRLNIGERIHVGYSEGARISLIASLAAAELTKGVVAVNGVGMGSGTGGVRGLAQSNTHRIGSLRNNPGRAWDLLSSGAASTAYTALHPRRTYKEKKVIDKADSWRVIKLLTQQGVPVSVLHAEADELISYAQSLEQAQRHPEVRFHTTEGTHSNVYEPPVRRLIIEELLSISTNNR